MCVYVLLHVYIYILSSFYGKVKGVFFLIILRKKVQRDFPMGLAIFLNLERRATIKEKLQLI